MSISVGPNPIKANLVFCVDFANPKSVSSVSSVRDIAGRNIAITLQNAANNSIVIANGYAEFFPAGDTIDSSYYSIASTYFNDIRNEMTCEAVIMGNTAPTGGGRLISPRTTESNQPLGFAVLGSFNGIGVEVNSDGIWKTTSYTIGPAGVMNTWIHVIQTVSNTANCMITYANAANIGRINVPGTLGNGNGFLIGRGYYGGTNYPAGKVAYLKVYDRALTPEEVQKCFLAFKSRFGR
jgi:hypothetical protein